MARAQPFDDGEPLTLGVTSGDDLPHGVAGPALNRRPPKRRVMEICAADAEDAEAISRLAAEVPALHAKARPGLFKPARADTFPAAANRARMSSPGHRFWVAVDDGRVVGYAYVIVNQEPDTPWRYPSTVVTLDQMGVAAAARGRGAGTGLIAAMRADALDARRGGGRGTTERLGLQRRRPGLLRAERFRDVPGAAVAADETS